MELIIIVISILAILTVLLMMKMNVKELEKIALDTELNEITDKYPSNIEICKTILKKLKNEKVQIEENSKSEATIYIAISNKILIGNMHKSFTRIQTIAHECLHSVQDRKMLIFNFIYSNLYLLYFVITTILLILNKLPNEIFFTCILLILSFVYYVVRIFLENDAMLKAEYLAKEYMLEQKISSKEEIEKVVQGFKKINDGCIKGTNAQIFVNIMIKVTLFNALALIF